MRRAKTATKKPAPIVSVLSTPLPKTQLREWDRATTMLTWFAVSGFLAEVLPGNLRRPLRPASIMLVGGPGSGKSELLDRFRRCYWISYHSDLTVRSLLPLLRKSEAGAVTHLGAPEFNKFFQRKSSVFENCIGLLSMAMEEGVETYSVGGVTARFEKARVGLFAGMTPGTLSKRKDMLGEMGFLSRACVLEWHLPRGERDEIMGRMNRGDLRDLEPVSLVVPEGGKRSPIRWDQSLGPKLMDYVRSHWATNDLRTFQRFRTLCMAIAYTQRRSQVTRDDLEQFLLYDDYWQRMIGED